MKTTGIFTGRRRSALMAATALSLTMIAAGGSLARAEPATGSPPQIEAKRLSEHIRILASDAFEGRAPGSEGEKKTIAYITQQLAGLGLKPAGDRGGWTQAVPLRRFETRGPIRASFDLNGKARPVQNLEDIVLNSRSGDARIALANAPVVFIGFGTSAPERSWDDFKDYDLHGKVAVVLVNDPDNGLPESDPIYGRFDGPLQTYYGRWTYKMEEATRRGAAGILVVQEDGPAGYGWNTTKNSNSAPQFEIASEGHKTLDTKVRGWVTRDVAAEIFKAAGLDFDAEKRRAQAQDFRPVELKGVRFSASFAVSSSTIVSHNILGKLPGAKHPDETVMWTAHWDHLGVGTPDARGDRIYNGANDNASGSATLLELARLYATRPRTERTVQFLFTTAEEKGILGAEYYVTHPVAPLEKTVAVINFDGANMKGVAKDISSRGGPNSPLDPLLAKEAEKAGRKFTPDQWLAQAYFFRADQFPFAKYGVPGIAYASGLDLEKGGRAAGLAWAANFLATRYHMPSDEWSPDMNLEGAVVDTAIYDSMGQTLANSRIWPEWPATSPFKAIRDKSATLRQGGGQ